MGGAKLRKLRLWAASILCSAGLLVDEKACECVDVRDVDELLVVDVLVVQAITRSTSSTAAGPSAAVRSRAACPTALRSPSPTSAASRDAGRPSSSTVSLFVLFVGRYKHVRLLSPSSSSSFLACTTRRWLGGLIAE